MKSINKQLISLVLFLLIFSFLPTRVFAQISSTSAEISRIFGNDRIETSIAICDEGWNKAETVIIAPGNQENLIDAMIAVSLAGQQNAPILLTDKNKLDSRVLNKILQLQTRKVYAVGALSDEAVESLRSQTGKLNNNLQIEVLKGATRQETANIINSHLVNTAGSLIIGNNALSDALSAGSFAYSNKYSYMISPNINSHTGKNFRQTDYLIGGKALLEDIPGVTRISGNNRYETNRAVIESLKFKEDIIYIANGSDQHLADSLVGAALAGITGSPIYLTDRSGSVLTDLIKDKINSGSKVVILGGPSSLSEEARMRIAGINNDFDSPSSNSNELAVSAIESLNLLQFSVKFSRSVNRESAENVENYILNGKSLTKETAVAELQSDNRTVVVTFNPPQSQYSNLMVEVKEFKIFAADRRTSAPGYVKLISVTDSTRPLVKSISAEGNRKLTVRFSEPISLSNVMADFELWKMDSQGITTKGLEFVKIIQEIDVGDHVYGSGLELYFAVSLEQGNHILEVPVMDESSGSIFVKELFIDGAGYRLNNQTVPCYVSGVTGSPIVKVDKVEGSTIYLRFDRTMYSHPQSESANLSEAGSVLNVHNYTVNNLNGSVLSADFVNGTGQTLVKLEVSPESVAIGVNLIILNKKIEDMFGKRLAAGSEDQDLRLNFMIEDDRVKPQEEKVFVVTPDVIQIIFSEKVNGLYAMNKANYNLQNSDGISIDIENITAIPDSNATMAAGSYPCTTIYQIHTSQSMYGNGYTLKISNIQDIALWPNTIDEVIVELSGKDNQKIRVQEILGKQGNNQLFVFFSEVMNEISIQDLKNYLYGDGDNPMNYRPLPVGTQIKVGPEKRSAVITFPDAYLVDNSGIGFQGHDVKYVIGALQVMNVKDNKGYSLDGNFYRSNIHSPSASAFKPEYITDSFLVREENNNTIVVEFKLDQVLDRFAFQDFQVGNMGNKIVADNGYLDGRKIILRYTNPAKISVIQSLGKDIMLFMQVDPLSINIAGVKPAAFPEEGYQVYDDQVRPRVLTWTLEETAGHAYVLVTFSEAIDGTVNGLYEDDFIFYFRGTDVKVQGVRIYIDDLGNPVPHILVYDLADGNYTGEGMSVRMLEKNISIRDVADRKKDHNTCLLNSTL